MNAMDWLLRQFKAVAKRFSLPSGDVGGKTTDRLLHLFQQKPEVRPEVLDRHGIKLFQITESVTAREFVAILAIWSTQRPITDVIQSLTRTSQAGWFPSIRMEFYEVMVETTKELDLRGFNRTASDLLKLGEIAADMHQDHQWRELFQQQIDRRVGKRIRDLPYLKQRGW
jgi:hypothetical protein